MKALKTVAILSAVAMLAACAKNPGSIPPVSMSNAYSGVDCGVAAQEREMAATRLASYSSQQRGAAAGDAVGVLFLGVPMWSLFGGDKAGHIATEKGKVLALDARLLECRSGFRYSPLNYFSPPSNYFSPPPGYGFDAQGNFGAIR